MESFNLIDEAFIPVRTQAGGHEMVNLRDTLVRSHEFASIADASPLTTFALYRFLMVIVHRVLEGEDAEAIRQAGKLPENRIADYLTRYRDRFDLFDVERPFLQRAVGEESTRPVSDLFAELPVDTNINHARHAQDDAVAACPTCCTHGMLRISPFCGQGGQGKAPSINAPTPAYFLPVGATVFETLLLNRAAIAVVAGPPAYREVVGPAERENCRWGGESDRRDGPGR